MASGFGVRGGTSRCFSFWQEFRKCYVTSESPSDCSLQRDDYLECLHHTKEIQRRIIEVQHEESEHAREMAKKADGAPSLGFIDFAASDNKAEAANAKSPSDDGKASD